MEFSLRLKPERNWIPISFFNTNRSGNRIHIGNTLLIREYQVELESATIGVAYHYSVEICNIPNIISHPVEFRWLQTSNFSGSARNVWSLDNVNISYCEDNTSTVLLRDSFDDTEIK